MRLTISPKELRETFDSFPDNLWIRKSDKKYFKFVRWLSNEQIELVEEE